jgi:hypothetical protein
MTASRLDWFVPVTVLVGGGDVKAAGGEVPLSVLHHQIVCLGAPFIDIFLSSLDG